MSTKAGFDDILKRDGFLVYKTRGVSMEPMLRDGKDVVVLKKPGGRLKLFDVPLYRRRDRRFTLHRIIAVRDNDYVIRGDNTFVKEYVPRSDVVGVLTEFKRKGKNHTVDETGYRVYVRVWHFIYPLRRVLHKLRRFGGKIKRALKGKTAK